MSAQSNYWLESVLDAVEARQPLGSILVCSGITPSGPYHVGHAREILTAEAIRRGLEQRGRTATHTHNVDDFDALRKRYTWLPESYESQAGKPVYLIPAPDGKARNYAEQYFSQYEAAAVQLGIPMTIWRSHVEYQAGVFADLITTALNRRDEISQILAVVSGREVPLDWQPIQILDAATESLRTAEFLSYDAASGIVEYRSNDGTTRQAAMKKGEVKLDWRIDWPARWALLGVHAEGFGKEHATKGGSYDTGAMIAREIFGVEPPVAVPFNPINLKGDTRKMSSSLGNLVTIHDALQFIPPEILRYFVFKSLPTKVLDFDPGIGMYSLIDEYAATESAVQTRQPAEFAEAWRVSVLEPSQATVSTIPFSHLVATYQAASRKPELTLQLLAKTHPEQATTQTAVLKRQLTYVEQWLDSGYAPEAVVFAVATTLPQVQLTEEQTSVLDTLAAQYPVEPTAELVQTHIFETIRLSELPPRTVFELLYQLFIGKPAGPKLGAFLSDLDRDFVVARLRREG